MTKKHLWHKYFPLLAEFNYVKWPHVINKAVVNVGTREVNSSLKYRIEHPGEQQS